MPTVKTPSAKIAKNKNLLDKSIRIEEAENGYVISVSGEDKKNNYFTKRWIARSEFEAKKLAGELL